MFKDPSAAEAWMNSLQEGSVRDQVLLDTATAAVQMNPEIATQLVAEVDRSAKTLKWLTRRSRNDGCKRT